MDILKLQAFIKAVDTGSILAASQELGYTASGINRMLNVLEEELQVHLLVRSRKGVALTPEGRSLLPVIRKLVRCNDELMQEVSIINGRGAAELHIGSFYSFAANRLPEIIGKFTEEYPGISVRIHEYGTASLLSLLKESRVDCCFMLDPMNKEFDFYPLFEEPLLAWIPEEHPLQEYKAIPVREFSKYPFISMKMENNWLIKKLFFQNNLTPNITYTSHAPYTIHRMVEGGLGVSANDYLTGESWEKGVRKIPFDPPETVTMGIVLPKNWQHSLLLEQFVRFVKSCIDEK